MTVLVLVGLMPSDLPIVTLKGLAIRITVEKMRGLNNTNSLPSKCSDKMLHFSRDEQRFSEKYFSLSFVVTLSFWV